MPLSFYFKKIIFNFFSNVIPMLCWKTTPLVLCIMNLGWLMIECRVHGDM